MRAPLFPLVGLILPGPHDQPPALSIALLREMADAPSSEQGGVCVPSYPSQGQFPGPQGCVECSQILLVGVASGERW